MDFVGFIKNVATFGASGRVEDAVDRYKSTVEQFNKIHDDVEQKRVQLNTKLERLVFTKKTALLSLTRMKDISKNLVKLKQRDLGGEELTVNIECSFKAINKTITAGELAMNSVKGATVGVSTAMGAWALAGTFGTASTGAAISGLYGAAATNATLAYLGGGAAALGGGGMAAGTAVLGGLVALPALVLTGVFSHVAANKKIKELEEKEYEVTEAIGDCKKALLSFELIGNRSDEVASAVDTARVAFESEFDKVYKAIYPSFYSKFLKAIRKMFTGKYFNANDLLQIQYIGGIATSLAQLIDQKIFDENGNPI